MSQMRDVIFIDKNKKGIRELLQGHCETENQASFCTFISSNTREVYNIKRMNFNQNMSDDMMEFVNLYQQEQLIDLK